MSDKTTTLTRKYLFSDTSFTSLMHKRIYHVLLVATRYDTFIIEDDGRIDEQIFNEYVSLNLRYPPQFLVANTHAEAEQILEEENIDLIILMLSAFDEMIIDEIKQKYGGDSFCAIGGARTSCESAYAFQKFCRETMDSPHVDNCARVCHSPSLKGMRATMGEGAATNPYNDIDETEFMVVIGSNTMEAHPIIANRIVNVAKQHNNLAVIDVRETKMVKFAKHNCVIPFESNLLVLNMMAYVIMDEEL